MILDRTIQPLVSQVDNVNIPAKDVVIAPNGMEFHIINMGDQDVVRIDLMFGAGKWDQDKFLVAMFTNLLLKEGVEGMSSQQVAEMLDYYGAWLQPSASFHNSFVTMYSLNKHITHTLPVLESIVKSPLFPESEFDVIRNRRKQQFLIEEEKVQVKAFNKSINLLFGDDHPYGQHAGEDAFDKLTTDDLKAFHKKYYHSGNCKVLLTGKVTDDILKEMVRAFGETSWGSVEPYTERTAVIEPSKEHNIFIEKEDAQQAAVRVVLPLVGRENPDYYKLRVLNTLLGGFFGSRLMANIREDKGYTYGIGSNITTLKNSTYLSISTQAATEYTELVIKEIFHEIKRLREELVQDDELDMLRGYLMGEIARLFDGPFSVADAYQSLLSNHMGVDYYYQMMDSVKSITAEEMMSLANKYFIDDNFYVVVAGGVKK